MEDLRKEIDKIDDCIAELFGRRMGLAAEVAKYKAEHGLPVLNAERERSILDRVCASVDGELREYVKLLFETLFEVSREYQNSLM